jgi:ribosomal subunit interface protein
MSIEVTLRHSTANEELKSYAKARAEKILLQFPKVDSIHVILDMQRHLFEAEFVVHQKGLTAVGVKEHSDDFQSVIDAAAARAEKQLKKLHDKRISAHQGAGARA